MEKLDTGENPLSNIERTIPPIESVPVDGETQQPSGAEMALRRIAERLSGSLTHDNPDLTREE